MAQLTTQLIERKQIAEDTFEVAFQKPTDFSFLPGQYVQLILPESSQLPPRESIRLLSMTSAPYEEKLSFAFRSSDSEYKNYLLNAPLHTDFAIRGPFGYFTLDNNHRKPVIFLAGGIGVTPFISMLKQETFLNTKRNITLLYSNTEEKKAAYVSELQEMAKINQQFSFHHVYDRLTWKDILHKTQFSLDHLWYIAGSTNMVGSITQILLDHEIPPYKIHTELFTGEQEEGGCENCTCGKRAIATSH